MSNLDGLNWTECNIILQIINIYEKCIWRPGPRNSLLMRPEKKDRCQFFAHVICYSLSRWTWYTCTVHRKIVTTLREVPYVSNTAGTQSFFISTCREKIWNSHIVTPYLWGKETFRNESTETYHLHRASYVKNLLEKLLHRLRYLYSTYNSFYWNIYYYFEN